LTVSVLDSGTTPSWASWRQAVLAYFRRSRPYRLQSGHVAIWLLSGLLLATAAALFVAGAGNAPPVISSFHLPFWALVIAFAAAERFVVHVHFRRSAHSMSIGEIPLVFGLMFASGHDVILAGALGRIVVLALHRKLPPIRLAFNLGQFLLGFSLAVLVFHTLASRAIEVTPRLWASAMLATAVNSVTAVLLIGLAVSLSEGRLSAGQITSSLRTDLAGVIANTSLGLCAATIVSFDSRAAILMAVPVAGMFIAFRAYVAERQRHARLDFLYQAGRALSGASEVGAALEQLLVQALDAFRAEAAEIVFFAPHGDDALRTTVRANRPAAVLEPVEPAVARHLRSLIERQEQGACAASSITDGPLAEYLRAGEFSDGIFAVLKGERSWIGAMMVGNPSGVVDHFSADDVKLFETLANNTTFALENERLGQAVWRMRELQRELQHQASHDPLTGLCNRLLFAQRVEAALHAGGNVSVVFIDINDFKTVNDSLGHSAGDDLLLAVARRLSDSVRPSDTVARLGGDEFAILLGKDSSQHDAIEVTERINRHLADRFLIGGQSISVRASAGIATSDGGEVNSDELIRNADVAMYSAKRHGKVGYELFEAGMEVPVMRRHGLKQRLRDAVREESLVVQYQPIVELETGRVTACEALVRWLDAPRGCINPSAFIPVAEEIGAVAGIGRSVLRSACSDAQRWLSNGPTAIAIHVNVSPVELHERQFVPDVAAVLHHTGLSPERLVLEITESVMLTEPEKSMETVDELRALGVQLALDDFGTGYSSLRHLRSLPVDWLKVGMPFLDRIESGGADRPFVRMVLDLAANLGLAVVAEGIESAGQLAALRELGCALGQGFYLGAPSDLDLLDLAPRWHSIAQSALAKRRFDASCTTP
jgi:diguanylate cyclase (GGDEF)-like protein